MFHGEEEKKDCRKTAKIRGLRRIDTRKNPLKILPVKHSIDRKLGLVNGTIKGR